MNPQLEAKIKTEEELTVIELIEVMVAVRKIMESENLTLEQATKRLGIVGKPFIVD
jgi:hypothetical protein